MHKPHLDKNVLLVPYQLAQLVFAPKKINNKFKFICGTINNMPIEPDTTKASTVMPTKTNDSVSESDKIYKVNTIRREIHQ